MIADFFSNFTWLIILAASLVIEAIVPGLISIWFAAGALSAIIASCCGATLSVQGIIFLIVSVGLLIATRPLAKKYINSKAQPTNADAVIGTECIVIEEINNLHGTGAVTVNGKVWTARADNSSIIPVGSVVKALRIEGVKLIVK